MGGGGIGRLHQEDFCQALGRMPSAKYEQRGGPTLGDMVRVIRQESTRQESDILALADFLIINVVAGAPDGHSKKITILRVRRHVGRAVVRPRDSGTRPRPLWVYPLTC